MLKKGDSVLISKDSRSKYKGKMAVIICADNSATDAYKVRIQGKTLCTTIRYKYLSKVTKLKVHDSVTIVKGSRHDLGSSSNPNHGVVGRVSRITSDGVVRVLWPNGFANTYKPYDLEVVETSPKKFFCIAVSAVDLTTYEEAVERVKKRQTDNPSLSYALVEVVSTSELIVTPPVVKMHKVSQ